jgi:aminoglycoside 6-adenylyltransferase
MIRLIEKQRPMIYRGAMTRRRKAVFEPMRSEQEMMDLILGAARRDRRVRLAGMNGSRVNPKAPRDEWQDYDVAYGVTETEPFIRDKNWIDVFGKRIIMQTPEAMTLFSPDLGGWFSWLMLFEDGARIDLTIFPLEDLDRWLGRDKLTVILLDKDGRTGKPGRPAPAEPSDETHWVRQPGAECFDDCCNEFWWVATYVVKGLRRDELLYAADHLGRQVRGELLRMLSWEAGLEHGFSFNPGKSFKYLKNYLPPETWRRVLRGCRYDSAAHIRESLLESLALFRESSRHVAGQLGFPYPNYDEKVSAYLAPFLLSPGKI